MKPVGKPDAGNRHVRFDERGRETGLTPPRPSSTLLRGRQVDWREWHKALTCCRKWLPVPILERGRKCRRPRPSPPTAACRWLCRAQHASLRTTCGLHIRPTRCGAEKTSHEAVPNNRRFPPDSAVVVKILPLWSPTSMPGKPRSGDDRMQKSMNLSAFTFFLFFATPCPALSQTEASPHLPAKIKILIRKAEVLDNKCRAPGMDANGRACTARNNAADHLQRLGWCWDSEKTDAIEADYHWMRCSLVRSIP